MSNLESNDNCTYFCLKNNDGFFDGFNSSSVSTCKLPLNACTFRNKDRVENFLNENKDRLKNFIIVEVNEVSKYYFDIEEI